MSMLNFMEEKEKIEKIPHRVKFIKRVSLFKKRKKLEIRPFVKEKRNRQYKNKLLNILFFVFLLLGFCALLWAVRFYVLPLIIKSQNNNIISPLEDNLTQEEILTKIQKSGLDIENIKVSSDLATATFTLHRQVKVIIDPRKGIESDLNLLKEIDLSLTELNKRATYIDLRYSKPIVKI